MRMIKILRIKIKNNYQFHLVMEIIPVLEEVKAKLVIKKYGQLK